MSKTQGEFIDLEYIRNPFSVTEPSELKLIKTILVEERTVDGKVEPQYAPVMRDEFLSPS